MSPLRDPGRNPRRSVASAPWCTCLDGVSDRTVELSLWLNDSPICPLRTFRRKPPEPLGPTPCAPSYVG